MNSRDKSAQPIELPQSTTLPSPMHDDRHSIVNPYSPAPEVETDPETTKTSSTVIDGFKYPSLRRTILRWTAVCGIAAAPSFLLGWTINDGNVLGMLAAILTFIGFYIGGDLISRHWPIRRSASVRRTLVFVYATRIVLSIIFPVGIYLDMATGIAMLHLMNLNVDQLRQPDSTFGAQLARFWLSYGMTFFHAILMNIILCVWGLICLPFFAIYTNSRNAK